MTDREKLAEVLAGVHDFYGKELSEFAMGVWLETCKAFDVEQVTKALSAHLMDPEHGQFMPRPADIVRQLQGTQTDRSLIAWGKVLDAAQRVGAYTSVAFDDGVIHAVIEDMGGWPKVCRTPHDELSYTQKRFCDSYRAYARRTEVGYPGKLRGEHELTNAIAFKGKAPQVRPTLIGNPGLAMRVIETGSEAPKTQITPGAALRLVDGS